MGWYFANSNKCFYHDDHHTKAIRPKDCVAISDETHDLMVLKSHEGRGISIDKKGQPIFTDSSASDAQLWNVTQQCAEMALIESADLVMRHLEKGEAVPAAVTEYREALRAIVAAETGMPGVLPARPVP